MLVSLIQRFYKDALNKISQKKSIGYFCSYIPSEIIESHGFIPVRLTGSSEDNIESRGEKFIASEACSFCKQLLGMRALNKKPHRDINYLIVPTTCDQIKRNGEVWERDFNTPVYYLNVPSTWESSVSLNMYWNELKWLDNELGAISTTKKNIKDIVCMYNYTRKRIFNLLGFLSPQERILLLRLFSISTSANFNRYLNAVEKRVKKISYKNKINLLLIGCPVNYNDAFNREIFKYRNIDIFDMTCTGKKQVEFDIHIDGDTLSNIAVAYLSKPLCVWERPNSRFYSYIKKEINTHNINGVIYKIWKFCDLWKYEYNRFVEWVNVPSLFIETNSSSSQVQQMKTRLSAFMETIGKNVLFP